MGGYNRGKAFEQKFKEDFKKTVPNATIDRLYDQVSQYKTISNISDFIGYVYPNIFYLECKSHKGNTFPFSDLTQYDKLSAKVGIKGVRVGVIIWFIDHDKVLYVPISSITKLKSQNIKSININTIDKDNYKYLDIPSTKKIVFLDSDYSILSTLNEGE